MLILLTNDDGYQAPGLAALERAAQHWGDVVIVAPETEQSYMGHRVTTVAGLRATAYRPGGWHVNGTPADCVRVALRAMGLKPDLVLSGINRGGNLGVDVYTSGTAAAAREAAILGVPGVAFSQYVTARYALDWGRSEVMVQRALREVEGRGLEAGTYWNVNLPHLPEESDAAATPVCWCELDGSPQDVRFEERDGVYRYAGRYAERPRKEGADVALCFDGNVTVSRLAI